MDESELVARIIDALKHRNFGIASKLAAELEDVQKREWWFEEINKQRDESWEICEGLQQSCPGGDEDSAILKAKNAA